MIFLSRQCYRTDWFLSETFNVVKHVSSHYTLICTKIAHQIYYYYAIRNRTVQFLLPFWACTLSLSFWLPGLVSITRSTRCLRRNRRRQTHRVALCVRLVAIVSVAFVLIIIYNMLPHVYKIEKLLRSVTT